MLVGDSTSGTFSATVGLYGGYRRSQDTTGDQLAQTGPSRLILQPAAPVVLSLATETWTGTDGAAWPAQWTSMAGNTIQANRGRMTATGGYAAQAAFLSGMTAATDSDTVVTVLPPTSGEWYATVAARASAITAASNVGFPSNGIGVQIGSNSSAGTTPNFVQVHRCSAGTNTQVNFTGISLTADAAGYKMRLNVQGSTYRVRVWGASSPEPTAWTVTYVDATPFLTAGKTWLGVQSGAAASAVTVDADDLTVTDGAPPSATAAGTITLGGTASAIVTATASGGITLGGAVTGQAAATATGAIALGGTATATSPGSSATGTITLSGTVTARAATTASGALTLGGTVTARASATTSGTITLGGTVTALVPATAAGLITLSGLANAQAADYVTHTYVTAALTDNAGAVALLDQTGAADLNVFPPGLAALASDGRSTVTLTADGTSTAMLADRAGLSALQTTT